MATVYLDEATCPDGINVNISSGTPANNTATGTHANVTAGAGGATSGDGGGINLQAGSAPTIGNGGIVTIIAGDGGSTSGAGGAISFVAGSGDGAGVGGLINLFSGTGIGAASGNIWIQSGDVFGAGNTGTVDIIAGTAHGPGAGGPVLLQGGRSNNGAGGSATVQGGTSYGGVGIGGDVFLTPGRGNGARDGVIRIDTGLPNFSTDAAALSGGVPVTGLYRSGNEVRINAAAANEGGSIDIVIDGAGAVITTGLKGYLPPAPFAMTLNQATLTANAAGSVVVNIWKCTYAQFDAGATHPVVGDKITASAPPTISAATKSQDSTLTGWTTAIAAGDILAFNIDSIATIQQVGLSLKYTKA